LVLGDLIMITIKWNVGMDGASTAEKNKAVDVVVDEFDKLMQTLGGNEPLIGQERLLIRSFLIANLSGKVEEIKNGKSPDDGDSV